jgi:hypothetical protein
MDDEKTYCNINKPPDSIKSSFDTITIYFYKGIDPWPKLRNIEGFRIVYTLITKEEEEEEEEEDKLNNQTVISEGISIKFKIHT